MGNIPSVIYYNASEVLYNIAMNITGFFATAFLSSLLAEQVRSSREQLKEKDQALKHLEALYENIIQSISSGILTVDKNGEITSFNRAAQEITGFDATRTVGTRLDRLFPPPLDTHPPHSGLLPPTSLPQRFEINFLRRDGAELFLGLSTSVLRDKTGNETGSIVTFQDLTKYREMEDQIKRMDRLAAIGRLAAGIAHEIRNPLTSLSGSIQVLRDELDLASEDLHLMDIALRETNRLNNLITDFLLFAQPERGEKTPTNLTAVIEETLELFTLSRECRDTLSIDKKIPPELFVEGNAEQLKQVFWNILKNSAQAQPDEGFIRIEGKTEVDRHDATAPDQRRIVTITVVDGGCGIPHEVQQRIFDPFFTTKDFGSGLGLAITYRIIESHSGYIAVHSQPGQGTRVTISLPLLVPAPS
jgi:two-component system sensor histidine kinase PilS (NtrC family)